MIPRTDRKETTLRLATAKGFVTVRQLAARFGVTRTTVQKDLTALLKAGKLLKRGKGSDTYYTPPDA